MSRLDYFISRIGITKLVDVQRMFKQTKKAFGRLDILVNNAGVFAFEPLETVSDESFYRQMNTHVLGNLLCSQQAVELFEDNGGSIINISSTVSTNPMASLIVYCAGNRQLIHLQKYYPKNWDLEKYE